MKTKSKIKAFNPSDYMRHSALAQIVARRLEAKPRAFMTSDCMRASPLRLLT